MKPATFGPLTLIVTTSLALGIFPFAVLPFMAYSTSAAKDASPTTTRRATLTRGANAPSGTSWRLSK